MILYKKLCHALMLALHLYFGLCLLLSFEAAALPELLWPSSLHPSTSLPGSQGNTSHCVCWLMLRCLQIHVHRAGPQAKVSLHVLHAGPLLSHDQLCRRYAYGVTTGQQ
jgi:hypothetical protein